MNSAWKNVMGLIRGYTLCSVLHFQGKCSFSRLIRIFKGAQIEVDKGGELIVEQGVTIGERCICTVRKNAVVKIGSMASFNSDCKIVCHKKIEVGDNTIFGPNVLIYDHDHIYDPTTGVKRKEYEATQITIGSNCWIGAGSIILRGTQIGDNCVVGAGSVIKGQYPAGTKIIQKRTSVWGGKMKIFMATDVRILVCDGKLLASPKYSTILNRYYKAFGPMVLCTRFEIVDTAIETYDDISYMVDRILKIDSLYAAFWNRYSETMEAEMNDCALVICRCPSIIAFKAADAAVRSHKPYFTEIMGDPWDAYWNHGIEGKIVAPYMFFKMKLLAKNADFALYVTSQFLQRRYPCKNETVAASNVLVHSVDESVLDKRVRKIAHFDQKQITVMTTAAVHVRHKGQRYMIKAIPKLNKRGIFIKYIVAGEGDNRYLSNLAKHYKVSEQVVFPGRLPLGEVLETLDRVDIYIQPSLQEGLPRALIEAMSRGCICIGANTAGIPELLDANMIVKRRSVRDIVKVIQTVCALSAPEKIAIAKRNYMEAQKYDACILDERRDQYYRKVRKRICKE